MKLTIRSDVSTAYVETVSSHYSTEEESNG